MHRELFEIDALLAPLDGPSPCGPDLSYEPEFQAMERAATGKPEHQYGEQIYPAEPPNWSAALDQALDLSRKTRDVRVAVIVWRGAVATSGLAGAASALELIHGLLARHWPHVHPVLDEDDGQDPTMRLSALMPLCALDQGLAELRQARLVPELAGLTLRAIELAANPAAALPAEQALTEGELLDSLEALCQRHPQLSVDAQRAHAAALAIASLLDSKPSGSVNLDFAPLPRLLQLLLTALARRAPYSSLPAPDEHDAPAASHKVETDPGSPSLPSVAEADQPLPQARATDANHASPVMCSRADAERLLDELLRWFKAHEPSHPAPLLIRRIQRWMSMDFLAIVHDLGPEQLPHFERATGAEHQP